MFNECASMKINIWWNMHLANINLYIFITYIFKNIYLVACLLAWFSFNFLFIFLDNRPYIRPFNVRIDGSLDVITILLPSPYPPQKKRLFLRVSAFFLINLDGMTLNGKYFLRLNTGNKQNITIRISGNLEFYP